MAATFISSNISGIRTAAELRSADFGQLARVTNFEGADLRVGAQRRKQ